MKIIKTSDLKTGMITDAPVKTKRGQVLIPERTELDRQLISRMEFYGITSACIDEDSLGGPAPEPPILDDEIILDPSLLEPEIIEPEESEPEPIPEPAPEPKVLIRSYSQKVKQTTDFQEYSVQSSFCTAALRESFEAFIYDHVPMDTDALVKSVKALFRPGQTIIQCFDMIHNMRSVDDSIYSHSLNVALISRILGKWLHWSREDLDELILAGLLHDIGKAMIPEEVLNKEGKLTDDEFDMIKQHPQAGYNLLKNMHLDPRIKKATLMHHERCDGSGYPMGLEEIMIDDFALVIAIADVYDAMTAARKYRSPLCPFQVITEFEKDGYHKYKPEYILTFLRRIAITYQNNRVILSNGQAAKIILLNQNSLAKPLVQLDDGSCIDLASSPLFIQSIV